jgi:hypothetical protein
MPFATNLDRNNRVYKLWEEGKTVEEISRIMRIPRSSAGYYVRKFNQAATRGKTLTLPLHTETKQEDIVLDFYAKGLLAESLVNIMRNSDAQNRYYSLASIKLLYELTPKLALTKEQKEMLDSAIKDMGIAVPGFGQERSSGVKKGKRLVDLDFGDIKGKV